MTGIRRRKFLALTAIGVLSAAACGNRDPVVVRLASGEEGGFYHAFARLLAEVAAADGAVRIEPLTTSGSQENLDLLAEGGADAALALADSARAARGAAVAIGRVYENYLQLAVRVDGPIRHVGELRGARVNLGAEGSGAALTGERLLRAAGIDPARDIAIEHRSLSAASDALRAGAIDALLWAGGVPTGALDVPNAMRLLDLGDLAAPLRTSYGPVYDRVAIPADAYPGAAAVDTVGVANLLLATPALPDRAASAIANLLAAHPDDLIPAEAAGTQFLDVRSLIGTGPIPLHPGAAAAYRDRHG